MFIITQRTLFLTKGIKRGEVGIINQQRATKGPAGKYGPAQAMWRALS